VVGIDLRLGETTGLEDIHVFGGEPGRHPEAAARYNMRGKVSGLFFQFANRSKFGVFIRLQSACRNFKQLTTCSVAILSDQYHLLRCRSCDYADSIRHTHDFAYGFVTRRFDDSIDAKRDEL